jgi:hypothetical protein
VFSLLLSVAIGSVAWAQAPMPTALEVRLRSAESLRVARTKNAELRALEDQFKPLLRRAVYPGQPGTDGSLPTAAELDAFDIRIQDWKNQLEQLYRDFEAASPERLERDALSIPHLGLLNGYLSLVANLQLARAYIHAPLREGLILRWKIRIPAALALTLQGNLEGTTSSLEVRAESETVYSVGFQRTFFLGQEISTIAQSDAQGPGQNQLLAYVQAQTLLQGAATLAVIRDLLGPSVQLPTPPSIPSALARFLPSARSSAQILSGERSRLSQDRLKTSFVQSFPKQEAQGLMRLLDLNGIARATLEAQPSGRSAGASRQANQILVQLFEEKIQRHGDQTAIVLSGELPIHPEELQNKLRKAAAEWCLAPLWQVLAEQQEIGTLEIGPTAQLVLDRLLGNAESQLSASIPESFLTLWIAAATRHAELARLDFRHQWISEIYQAARAVSGRMGTDTNPDPLTLVMTLLATSASESSASFRATLTERIEEAKSGQPDLSDWEALRSAFNSRLVELTHPRIITRGLLNSSLIESLLETHDFRPPAARYARLPPAIAEGMRENAARLARQEVRDLLAVARRLRFHRRSAPPTFEELALTEQERGMYTLLDTDTRATRFPLLSMLLPAGLPGVGSNPEPLADVLARQSTLQRLDAHGIATAWNVLEPALRHLDAQVRARMSRITSAQDWSTILGDAEILCSERMILDPDRVFSVSQNALADRMSRRSAGALFYEDYLNPYIAYGVTAILAVQVVNYGARFFIRRYTPFGDMLARMVTDPINHGFMRSLMVLGPIHTYFLHEELQHTESVEAAAASAAATLRGRVPSYSSIEGLRAQASEQRFFYRLAVVGDVLGIGLPYVVWPLVRPSLMPILEPQIVRVVQYAERFGAERTLREIRRDLQAAETLGLPPGQWEGIQRARELALTAPGLSEESRTAISAAEAHLLRRVARGETWTLERALAAEEPARALTPMEQRLRRAMGLPPLSSTGGSP